MLFQNYKEKNYGREGEAVDYKNIQRVIFQIAQEEVNANQADQKSGDKRK